MGELISAKNAAEIAIGEYRIAISLQRSGSLLLRVADTNGGQVGVSSVIAGTEGTRGALCVIATNTKEIYFRENDNLEVCDLDPNPHMQFPNCKNRKPK